MGVAIPISSRTSAPGGQALLDARASTSPLPRGRPGRAAAAAAHRDDKRRCRRLSRQVCGCCSTVAIDDQLCGRRCPAPGEHVEILVDPTLRPGGRTRSVVHVRDPTAEAGAQPVRLPHHRARRRAHLAEGGAVAMMLPAWRAPSRLGAASQAPPRPATRPGSSMCLVRSASPLRHRVEKRSTKADSPRCARPRRRLRHHLVLHQPQPVAPIDAAVSGPGRTAEVAGSVRSSVRLRVSALLGGRIATTTSGRPSACARNRASAATDRPPNGDRRSRARSAARGRVRGEQ